MSTVNQFIDRRKGDDSTRYRQIVGESERFPMPVTKLAHHCGDGTDGLNTAVNTQKPRNENGPSLFDTDVESLDDTTTNLSFSAQAPALNQRSHVAENRGGSLQSNVRSTENQASSYPGRKSASNTASVASSSYTEGISSDHDDYEAEEVMGTILKQEIEQAKSTGVWSESLSMIGTMQHLRSSAQTPYAFPAIHSTGGYPIVGRRQNQTVLGEPALAGSRQHSMHHQKVANIREAPLRTAGSARSAVSQGDRLPNSKSFSAADLVTRGGTTSNNTNIRRRQKSKKLRTPDLGEDTETKGITTRENHDDNKRPTDGGEHTKPSSHPVGSNLPPSHITSGPDRTGHKRSLSLDYTLDELSKLEFSQLQNEPFIPKTNDHFAQAPNSNEEDGIKQRLLQLSGVENEPSRDEHFRKFFNSLDLDDSTTCAHLIAKNMEDCITELNDIRRQKRDIALTFEKQIASQVRIVEEERRVLEEKIDGLRESGKLVITRPQPGDSATGEEG